MLLLLKARNHGWRANTFRSVRFRSDERFVSNSSIASWKRCTWWLENDWNDIFGRHVNNMHTGTGCKGPGHDRLTNRFLRGRVALLSVRSSPPSTPFSFARTPRKRKKSDIEHDLVFSLLIACSKERNDPFLLPLMTLFLLTSWTPWYAKVACVYAPDIYLARTAFLDPHTRCKAECLVYVGSSHCLFPRQRHCFFFSLRPRHSLSVIFDVSMSRHTITSQLLVTWFLTAYPRSLLFPFSLGISLFNV